MAAVSARVGMGVVGLACALHGWNSGGGAVLRGELYAFLGLSPNGQRLGAEHSGQAQTASSESAKNAVLLVRRKISVLVRGALAIYLMRKSEIAVGRVVAPFPGGLGSLTALTAALLVLDRVKVGHGSTVADGIENFARPACEFLGWWMPLFFSPPLATLPIAIERLVQRSGPSAVAKMLLVLVGGFLGTLISTAVISNALSGGQREDANDNSSGTSSDELGQGRRREIAPSRDLGIEVKKVVLGAIVCGLSAWDSNIPAIRQIWRGSFSALAFVIGCSFPKGIRSSLHPIITCSALTCVAEVLATEKGGSWRDSLTSFNTGPGSVFLKFLGPALIAFAFRLLRSRRLLISNSKPLVIGSVWATVFSLYGTAIASRLLGIDEELGRALLPRAITTPLAIAIANILKSNASLTVVGVVLSGILGANFGSKILTSLGIRGSIARGVPMGAAAHGLGVASLASAEPEASSAAAVSLILTGGLSTLLVSSPALRRSLLRTVSGTVA